MGFLINPRQGPTFNESVWVLVEGSNRSALITGNLNKAFLDIGGQKIEGKISLRSTSDSGQATRTYVFEPKNHNQFSEVPFGETTLTGGNPARRK